MIKKFKLIKMDLFRFKIGNLIMLSCFAQSQQYLIEKKFCYSGFRVVPVLELITDVSMMHLK